MTTKINIPENENPEMKRYCPVCNEFSTGFEPFGVKKRSDVRCPRCKTFERYRLLYLYLIQETDFFDKPNRVLDIGPLKGFSRVCQQASNLQYTSIDRFSTRAIHFMDITRLGLPDNYFDYTICYHVLEHIPEDNLALSEIARVMKPDGQVFFQVPIDIHRENTSYDPTTDEKDCERVYGQHDHIRIYGQDFQQALERGGFNVRRINYVGQFSGKERELMGLKDTYPLLLYETSEDMFIASKTK